MPMNYEKVEKHGNNSLEEWFWVIRNETVIYFIIIYIIDSICNGERV